MSRFPSPLEVNVTFLMHKDMTKRYRIIEFVSGVGKHLVVFEWGKFAGPYQYKRQCFDDIVKCSKFILAKIAEKNTRGYAMDSLGNQSFNADSFETMKLKGTDAAQLSAGSGFISKEEGQEMTCLQWLMDGAGEVVMGRLSRVAEAEAAKSRLAIKHEQKRLENVRRHMENERLRIEEEQDAIINGLSDTFGMF